MASISTIAVDQTDLTDVLMSVPMRIAVAVDSLMMFYAGWTYVSPRPVVQERTDTPEHMLFHIPFHEAPEPPGLLEKFERDLHSSDIVRECADAGEMNHRSITFAASGPRDIASRAVFTEWQKVYSSNRLSRRQTGEGVWIMKDTRLISLMTACTASTLSARPSVRLVCISLHNRSAAR